MDVISLALYGVADANSSQNSDKVEWAQRTSVIAARNSIIAEV